MWIKSVPAKFAVGEAPWLRPDCRDSAKRLSRRFAGYRPDVADVMGPHALAGALILVATLSAAAAEPNTNAYVGPAVSVMKANRACFTDSIDITGMLIPKEEIFVRPDSEGLQIAQVRVESGDAVTSGQALARLTAPESQGGAAVTVESPASGIVGRV